MSASIRPIGFPLRIASFFAAALVLAGLPMQAAAQTAPQLLPYTARSIAGGGTTAATKGIACAPAGNNTYTTYDTFGDGCLANQVLLTTPRGSVIDSTGAVYFTDYTTSAGVVHRIDPVTGIVTAVAGGGTGTPNAGSACSTVNSADSRALVSSSDVFGDGCLATSVKLARPVALALDASGNLYIADYYNYDVRKVSMSNGGVAAVAIINGGSGYTTAPTVVFTPPASGTTATGTATITAGVVTSVTITSAGTGYTSAPTVTFTPPTGTNPVTATGQAAYSGVITMLDGNLNGTTTATTGRGYADSCNPTPGSSTPCLLDAPYGVAVDKNGIVYISEEYYYAILAYNPGTTAATVLGVSIPAGTIARVVGARTGTPPTACTSGTATTNGCSNTTYTNNTQATQDFLYYNYNVALDSYGNLYVADYYVSSVPQVSAGTTVPQSTVAPAAGLLNNYAGLYPDSTTATTQTQTARGRSTLGSFGMGKDYGVGFDLANNLYITDTTNSLIWRVDGVGQYQYSVAGGGTATTLGGSCGATAPANKMAATDIYGDGCPGSSASFATPWGVSADASANIYVADGVHLLYREIATGAQFGATGASQTDYLDIHFAAGDGPATLAPYAVVTTVPAGTTTFTLGTPTCKTYADTTQDCILPVTATPPTPGAYSGVLTVHSLATIATYQLTGNFAQSPITRTVVSVTSATATANGCSGTTFVTGSPVTVTATIIYNGPVAPTGNIVFANNGVTVATVPVSNLGTSTAPVYGAVLPAPYNTFNTPGSENITAMYVYTPPTSGQIYPYVGSTSTAASFTIATQTFSISTASGALSTIKAGGQALYSFNLADTVYTGTISFSCANLPSGASCVFSPATIAAAGCSVTNTVALNIVTTGPVYSMPAGLGGTGSGPWSLAGMLAAAVLAAALGFFRRRIPARVTQLLLAFAFLLGASSLVACSKSSGTLITAGTPTGAYNNITVTATGSDGTTSSATISLTVN